jgi:hypothetical protein
MAAQLKLVEVENSTDEVDSLSLFAFEDGYSLQRDGWVQQVARPGSDSVVETLHLMIKGDDHDDLASKIQALDDYVRRVEVYSNDPTSFQRVYLRVQLPNETGARQAVVLDAQGDVGSSAFSAPLSPGAFVRDYTLTLDRRPYWEDVAPIDCGDTAAGISLTGGVYDYTAQQPGNIVGDVPGRLYYLDAYTTTEQITPSDYELYDLWLGFRGRSMGDPTKFEPVWECENAIAGLLSNSTSKVSDATARGSSKVQCSFASDESLIERMIIRVGDQFSGSGIYGSYEQRGNFIVLLRAKVGSGTTCRVRMSYGFANSSSWAHNSRVVIDSTNWYLYNLGTATIPIMPVSTLQNLFNAAIRLEAERVSGSNDLDMDCLILIPYSEGALYARANNPATSGESYVPLEMEVYTHAGRDEAMGFIKDTNGAIIASLDLAPHGLDGWSVPVGDGRLVVAGQASDNHDLDETLEGLGLQIFERWRTLRGSERS